jgi:hypothetical protein
LKCALVSKEWLSISRSDAVWKSHYQRDFMGRRPLLSNINKEFAPPRENVPLKITIPNQVDSKKIPINTPLLISKRAPQLTGKQPAFLEYFQFLDNELERESKKHIPLRLERQKCGVIIQYKFLFFCSDNFYFNRLESFQEIYHNQ